MSTQIHPNISDDEIKICEKLLSEGKLPHKFAMRVLRERKLKPHPVQRFQFSNDKHFDEKLDDVE